MKIWRSKKLLVSAVLIAVLLAGSIGGAALAADGGDADSSQPKTLLARVAGILGIDQQELEAAFNQAQKEMCAEAQDRYLQKLVDEERITSDQAEEYKSWWSAKPDVPLAGPSGHFKSHGFRGGIKWHDLSPFGGKMYRFQPAP